MFCHPNAVSRGPRLGQSAQNGPADGVVVSERAELAEQPVGVLIPGQVRQAAVEQIRERVVRPRGHARPVAPLSRQSASAASTVSAWRLGSAAIAASASTRLSGGAPAATEAMNVRSCSPYTYAPVKRGNVVGERRPSARGGVGEHRLHLGLRLAAIPPGAGSARVPWAPRPVRTRGRVAAGSARQGRAWRLRPAGAWRARLVAGGDMERSRSAARPSATRAAALPAAPPARIRSAMSSW